MKFKLTVLGLFMMIIMNIVPVMAEEKKENHNFETAYFEILDQKLPLNDSINPEEATNIVVKLMEEKFPDIYNGFGDDTTIVWVYRPTYETVDEFLNYYPDESKIPVLGLTPVWEGRIETNLGSNIQEGDYALRVAVTESGEIVGFENLKDVLINEEAFNYSADENKILKIIELCENFITESNLTSSNLVNTKYEVGQKLELVDLSSLKILNNNLWYDNYFINETLKITLTYNNGDEFEFLYRTFDEKIVGFYNNKFEDVEGWIGF